MNCARHFAKIKIAVTARAGKGHFVAPAAGAQNNDTAFRSRLKSNHPVDFRMMREDVCHPAESPQSLFTNVSDNEKIAYCFNVRLVQCSQPRQENCQSSGVVGNTRRI
jgi:hypothetical protein